MSFDQITAVVSKGTHDSPEIAAPFSYSSGPFQLDSPVDNANNL